MTPPLLGNEVRLGVSEVVRGTPRLWRHLQSAKSGLNKSWLDAAFGQFFSILGYIAGIAGAVVVEKNPAYTS